MKAKLHIPEVPPPSPQVMRLDGELRRGAGGGGKDDSVAQSHCLLKEKGRRESLLRAGHGDLAPAWASGTGFCWGRGSLGWGEEKRRAQTCPRNSTLFSRQLGVEFSGRLEERKKQARSCEGGL